MGVLAPHDRAFSLLQMTKFREECIIRENRKKARTLTAADRLAQRHLSDLSAFEGGVICTFHVLLYTNLHTA